jgi:cephalosporin hydroxylase
MLGLGKIIGVDIDIRKKNLKAINDHFLKKSIHLIEGSSISKKTISIVRKKLIKNKKTLVILDSNHSKDHVLEELRLYSEFVSKNSYIIVCDGIMQELEQFPGIPKSWHDNNPIAAIKIFLRENKNFILDEPNWIFNESKLNKSISYWPKGFLKRIR